MSQRDVRRGGGEVFTAPGQDGLLHRAFLHGAGLTEDDVRRSPVIGIATTHSDLNPCNLGLADLVEEVKAGIRAEGGLPLAFPTISISEPFTRPTSLYLRNLMAMDVEEMISTAPIDGVVLLGGCDKTVPAQLMGAISAGKPAVVLTAGPRPVSSFDGNDDFTIDDVWPQCEARRTGELDDDAWRRLESCVNVGVGTCNVMGTAITMAAIAEVLGFALPGSALPAAASPARRDLAVATGRQAVHTVRAGRTPTAMVTRAALENAFRVVCALGGSTNALIHLEAIAGRAGLHIGIDAFAAWSAGTPYVADVRPGGRFSLVALDAAGGVPAVMNRVRDHLHLDCLAARGTSWRDELDRPFPSHPAVVGERPLSPRGGIVVLRGNLGPRGAVLKAAGAHDRRLQQHRGRAVVFDGVEDLNRRIDDPELEVDADSVLVLRGMGVLGAPGMPEVGHIPVPAKLHAQGVTDMLRISDARMSGTATGTVVLHVTPEAAAGGPLSLVHDGDLIELDVRAGTLDLLVDDAELGGRASVMAPLAPPRRGFGWLHHQHVLQADLGCDFDFLRADHGAPHTDGAP